MDSNVSSELASMGALPATAHAGFRPCPVCQSSRLKQVFGPSNPIQLCRGCGMAFVNPLPPFAEPVETEEYFTNEYLPLYAQNREASAAERRAHIAAISRHLRPGGRPRHLDVGCALGFMLEQAKLAGRESVGVETSEFAARYASQRTGCPVFAGTLEEAAFPKASFDVVALMDVIEHVPAPASLIAEVFRILRPGGIAYIITPNFASLSVRLLGARAYGIWPHHHVVYFAPGSLRRLLLQVGFSKIDVHTKDIYPDNLNRILQGRRASATVDIKAAFAKQSAFSTLRTVGNSVFKFLPVGDKLVACACKASESD